MNYMNKQEVSGLQRLSNGIGQFIRYWGFRKIHGEIWSVVYLHKKPMSGIEIGKLLKVSKALISPALKELEAEGLIRQVQSENSKTKRYEAEEDVIKVIRDVLSRREKPMIEKIHQNFLEVARVSSDSDSIDPDRLQGLGLMIQMAQLGLGTLLDSDQVLDELHSHLK
jgi:DNA-binding transcriptional regulator GbsR (MarR family)